MRDTGWGYMEYLQMFISVKEGNSFNLCNGRVGVDWNAYKRLLALRGKCVVCKCSLALEFGVHWNVSKCSLY